MRHWTENYLHLGNHLHFRLAVMYLQTSEKKTECEIKEKSRENGGAQMEESKRERKAGKGKGMEGLFSFLIPSCYKAKG